MLQGESNLGRLHVEVFGQCWRVARAVWGHGTLGLPLAVIGYPLSIWIPAHYAGALELPLATVGTMLMLARFTDVITDPLSVSCGSLSFTAGATPPFLILGVPLMMLGAWQLFVPDPDVGLGYFLLWLTLFFLGATLISCLMQPGALSFPRITISAHE